MSLVAVAVSGGVDSLTAAFLLKKAGYSLIGLHFVTGYEAPGTSPETISAAVSKMVGIPVETIDLREAFRDGVVTYFTRTYLEGRTPNPCIMCNRIIKFGELLDIAGNLGACRLATGHYARLDGDPLGRFVLKKGVDPRKDQSYFLAGLGQDRLSRALFPLGDLKKQEVTAIARSEGLRPLTMKESQDVCFIQNRTYTDFLLEVAGAQAAPPGIVTDMEGKVVGRHGGLFRYTVGQRRGIGIPGPEPYYVVGMDAVANRLVVGRKTDLYSDGCVLTGMNWILPPPKKSEKVHIRLRYRHRAVEAEITDLGQDRVAVRFEAPQCAVTPGQAGVLYTGDAVRGGGWIASGKV